MGKRRDWEEWYADAREYYIQNGDLLIPTAYTTSEGHKLGRWIERQRAAYNNTPSMKARLSKAQIDILEKIGMVWKLEDRHAWEEWIERARAYREAHGDLLVPRNYVTDDGYALGEWITYRRKEYHEGVLTESEILSLDECGMVWKVVDRKDWRASYIEAKRYYEENGDLLVPHDYVTEDGYALGFWIERQRLKHSGKIIFCTYIYRTTITSDNFFNAHNLEFMCITLISNLTNKSIYSMNFISGNPLLYSCSAYMILVRQKAVRTSSIKIFLRYH